MSDSLAFICLSPLQLVSERMIAGRSASNGNTVRYAYTGLMHPSCKLRYVGKRARTPRIGKLTWCPQQSQVHSVGSISIRAFLGCSRSRSHQTTTAVSYWYTRTTAAATFRTGQSAYTYQVRIDVEQQQQWKVVRTN